MHPCWNKSINSFLKKSYWPQTLNSSVYVYVCIPLVLFLMIFISAGTHSHNLHGHICEKGKFMHHYTLTILFQQINVSMVT